MHTELTHATLRSVFRKTDWLTEDRRSQSYRVRVSLKQVFLKKPNLQDKYYIFWIGEEIQFWGNLTLGKWEPADGKRWINIKQHYIMEWWLAQRQMALSKLRSTLSVGNTKKLHAGDIVMHTESLIPGSRLSVWLERVDNMEKAYVSGVKWIIGKNKLQIFFVLLCGSKV